MLGWGEHRSTFLTRLLEGDAADPLTCFRWGKRVLQSAEILRLPQGQHNGPILFRSAPQEFTGKDQEASPCGGHSAVSERCEHVGRRWELGGRRLDSFTRSAECHLLGHSWLASTVSLAVSET